MPVNSTSMNRLDPELIEPMFYNESPELKVFINKDPIDSPKKRGRKPRKDRKLHPEVESYYGRLGKYPPLTRKEEILLFTKYTNCREKCKFLTFKASKGNPTKTMLATKKKLKDEIIHRNLRFVVKVASGFWVDGNVENLENLISSGNVGLIRAVDRFKVNMGHRFLTYAAHWIALEIRQEMSDSAMIRIPTWWQRVLRDIAKSYDKLSKGDSRTEIGVEEISKDSSVKLKHIKILSEDLSIIRRTQLPQRYPCTAYVEVGENQTPHTEKFQAPLDACLHSNTSSLIRKVMKRLTPKEKLVIEQIFGLSGDEPKNLRQVSNVLGNTSERVRQLKVKGITTLKKRIMASPELGGLGITNIQDLI